MVKFGRHLQFYLELEDENGPGDDPYIVPYTDIKGYIGHSQHQFTSEWMLSLQQASDDYSERVNAFWKRIFDDVLNSHAFNHVEDYRGLKRHEAITIYISTMGEVRSQEVFTLIKKLYSTAAMNCEALRKLVKKFDKGAHARGDEQLSSTLLHQLYSSSFASYESLEGCIQLFRDSLVVSEEEDAEEGIENSDGESGAISSSPSVRLRAEEQKWLTSMLSSISPVELSALVAHRGFHCPRDGSSRRPLENSLSAFELAWAGGVQLCECDVALTKDEKLVLAHDETFSRLALNPTSQSSQMKVGDLTLKEIISLTFKSGSRPPLLIDVLTSARALESNCKLVIEIKPGNIEASTALVRLFRHHPDLIDSCAVVMSFDAFIMHRLKCELNDLSSFLGYDSNMMPQVLLLTVAEQPQKHYELWLNILDPSPVHSWLQHENKPSLDGVYLQYQPEMLEPAGMQSLKDLSKQYRVGVWGYYKKDPDDYKTAKHLISCGVSFVNTDLPRTFKLEPKEHRMALY